MLHNFGESYCDCFIAPSVAIYDNGCNLHNYSLNREPNFFKRTWFLVDRFHWPNHCGMLHHAWMSII